MKKGHSTNKPPTNLNPATFAIDLLHTLHDPVTKSNVEFLESWEAAEGGAGPEWHTNNTAKYNPLNTTIPEPGYSKTGVQGNIGIYTSWSEGLKATAATLSNGLYGGIQTKLKTGSGSQAFAALQASPWDAGHYASGFPSLASGVGYAESRGATAKQATGSAKGRVGTTPGLTGPVAVPTAETKRLARYLYAHTLDDQERVAVLALAAEEQHGKPTLARVQHILHVWGVKGGANSLPGFTSGAYGAYLPQAKASYTAIGRPKVASNFTLKGLPAPDIKNSTVPGQKVVTDIASAFDSIPDFLKWISTPENLVRMGLVVVGIALVIIGFSKLGGSDLPGDGGGSEEEQPEKTRHVPVPVPV